MYYWGQGNFLRANIKLPSNCRGMKASQQFEKGIKAVCQCGKLGHQGNFFLEEK